MDGLSFLCGICVGIILAVGGLMYLAIKFAKGKKG